MKLFDFCVSLARVFSCGMFLYVFIPAVMVAQVPLPVVPQDKRGRIDAERQGIHDAANIRTFFYNYGMVGNYPPDPRNVDLSVFHSAEVPKGSGMNYTDGITPFVLARVLSSNGTPIYIMETGYRERQGISPYQNRVMRFAPRPGYFQPDPARNRARSPAMSHDPRTWPNFWPDKLNDPDDPGWAGSWNGYFGKRPAADQESFTVMDDDFYDAFDFYPDYRDSTRRGLGLKIEVRGFQWANPQASNVIFWHYDITNESTTDYEDNIIFGLYMDSGIGGSQLSCDGVFESDDDNAYFDRSAGLNLVYTWDQRGHGVNLSGNCGRTGYLGYAYLETPGNPFDGQDNDRDGVTDELRDGDPGQLIVGQSAIQNYVAARYNLTAFQQSYGPLEARPAYRVARWWTGDEDMDWVADLHDVGADGVPGTNDSGEGDSTPTDGEPNFDRTDLHESDQIGLTGFKMNRICPTALGCEDAVFFDDGREWVPRRLYQHFTDPVPARRFDTLAVQDKNIGFFFASGPFRLMKGKTERFSLALAYGANLFELRHTVKVVQNIYNANYQFAVPPPTPTVKAEAGDGYVQLTWDDVAERGIDPVTNQNDFEGYRIYRSTDPNFRDPRILTTGQGSEFPGNGVPIAQFDLRNGKKGYSRQSVHGVRYYLGDDTGIRHTFRDTTVVNGQTYYYAVCAYDYGYEAQGSDSLDFYPSENSIAVSRTPRGGTILPKNVVEVRPNPKVLGYIAASTSDVTKVAGPSVGTAKVRVVNSSLVPDNHVFHITFNSASPDSIRALSYNLFDSTAGKFVFTTGADFDGEGSGITGAGILPIITSPKEVGVDTSRSGFREGRQTNVRRMKTVYRSGGDALPNNLFRPGYPADLTVTFSNSIIDTSIRVGFNPPRPARFRVIAHTDSGEMRMKFVFFDADGNATLNRVDEYIDVVTYKPSSQTTPYPTWRIQIDTTGTNSNVIPLGSGDVYDLVVEWPLTVKDKFRFTSKGQFYDESKAKQEFRVKPYVVPNPYVGAASFEPERFAVSGRGERRIEFRGLPPRCTIRIYTVRGDLVQTLYHDGSYDGYVAWNLRTKDNLDVAPGLYIYHVDAGAVGTAIDKFAIIK